MHSEEDVLEPESDGYEYKRGTPKTPFLGKKSSNKLWFPGLFFGPQWLDEKSSPRTPLRACAFSRVACQEMPPGQAGWLQWRDDGF